MNSLVTLLVIAWFNEYSSENKKSWTLIENKSINWLNFQNIKYLELKEELLNLLLTK